MGRRPALGSVVDDQRDDGRQRPGGVLPGELLPDTREVAQELEGDPGVELALVLEQAVAEALARTGRGVLARSRPLTRSLETEAVGGLLG